MKKVFFLASALLLAACSREIIPEPVESIETQEEKTYTVSLKATFDPETRMSIRINDGEGEWSPSDQVALFTYKGEKIIGSIKDGDFDTSSPTFTFTIQDGDYIDEGATVYYPASIAVDGNPSQIVLPSRYETISSLNHGVPMKASVSEGTMAFKHLASLLYIRPFVKYPSYPSDGLKATDVELVIEGDNALPITGTFVVGDDLTLAPANTGDNGTVVSAPWELNEPYYFILPPGDYKFSFSILSPQHTVFNGIPYRFTYFKKSRIKSSYEFKRANLLKMPAFDPQCKEFYLTSSATDWSDNVTKARMIPTGPNSFLGALYSYKGPKGDWDLGLRILQKYNLGTHWNNAIGCYAGSDIATFGEQVGNIWGNDPGVYKVSITLYDDNWRYTSQRVGNEYDHQVEGGGLTLVGSFDSWAQGGIPLTQEVGHNWHGVITVSTESIIKPETPYEWKIKRNDQDDPWKVNWGDCSIPTNSGMLSSFMQINDDSHVNPRNATFSLLAGTYDVYFNDATGWVLFEKQ